MKIIMLNANLSGVGTYHRALWFARMCGEAGHQAVVCTTSHSNKLERRFIADRPNVTVIEGPRLGFDLYPGKGSNIDIFWRLKYLLKDGFDVIYAFEYHPNVSWPVCLARKGRRLISDWLCIPPYIVFLKGPPNRNSFEMTIAVDGGISL